MKTTKEFKKKLKKRIREYLPHAIVDITDDTVYVNFTKIHQVKLESNLQDCNHINAEDELIELLSSWAYYKIKGK